MHIRYIYIYIYIEHQYIKSHKGQRNNASTDQRHKNRQKTQPTEQSKIEHTWFLENYSIACIFDTDNNDRINYDEFCAMMRSGTQPQAKLF